MIKWQTVVKKILPRKLHSFAYCVWLKIWGTKIENKIKAYYQRVSSNKEIKDALAFLKNGRLPTFPYIWAQTIVDEARPVLVDEEKKLPYVMMGGGGMYRLYFPNSWDAEKIRNYFHGIEIVEQHPQSPHRYLTGNFTVNEDDIVVDGGAAEGNFGLHIVDCVKKLYLFEPEDQWLAPLQATFEPWKEKVVIVQKFISKHCDGKTVSLDAYFSNKEKPTFLKLDVEGFESDVLAGAKDLLSTTIQRAAICTYHRAEDEEILSATMRAHHFSVATSNGYMLVKLFDNAKPPYFRRGLIRCEKDTSPCLLRNSVNL